MRPPTGRMVPGPRAHGRAWACPINTLFARFLRPRRPVIVLPFCQFTEGLPCREWAACNGTGKAVNGLGTLAWFAACAARVVRRTSPPRGLPKRQPRTRRGAWARPALSLEPKIPTRAAGRVPSRGGPMAPSGCAGSGVCDRCAGHGPAASNELEERVGKQPWGKPNQHDGPAQEQRAHVARPSLGRLVHQGAHEQQTPSQPDHQHEGGPPWHPLGASHPKSQHEQRQESQNREAGCGDDIIHCVTLSQPQQRGKPPPAPGNDSRRWTRHGMAMSALASRAGAGGRTLPRDGGPGHGARRALPCLDTLGPVVVRGRLGGPRRATVDVGRARPAGASP